MKRVAKDIKRTNSVMTKRHIRLVGWDLEPFAALPQRLPDPAGNWKMEFSPDGSHAFELLSEDGKVFDAAVVDIALADMRGQQVLDWIRRRAPRALRYVYAPVQNDAARMKYVGPGNHVLAKPATDALFAQILQRGFAFSELLPEESIHALLSDIHSLPSPPGVYQKVVKELQSEECSVQTVGELIGQDPSMTARLLQLANSAAYGLHAPVVEAAGAVMQLGVETTKAVILMAHTIAHFEHLKEAQFNLEALWQHSQHTSRCARAIARAERVPESQASAACTAALLHDLGKLVMAANLPRQFNLAARIARRHQIPLWDVESDVMGASHAEIGAALLSLWGLPAEIVEAVALHHTPGKQNQPHFGPLAIVHVANAIARESRIDGEGFRHSAVDEEYLNSIEIVGQLEHWRQACNEAVAV